MVSEIVTLTLYSGPDPADPSRLLVRKVVQINDGAFVYEESTISKRENDKPAVHTQIMRISNWNLYEFVSAQERAVRAKHWASQNFLAFSLYYRKTDSNARHWSIVENSMLKGNGWTWLDAFKDFRDRRDMTAYLKNRWFFN